MLLVTVRTNAVAKFRPGVFADVFLYLIPVALVVADLLAERADGQDALQDLDLAPGHFATHEPCLANFSCISRMRRPTSIRTRSSSGSNGLVR